MADLPQGEARKSDAISAPYWTAQRRELARWFEDRAPSFTDGYIGAVQLLHTPGFPARVHFVCHIVRDIYRHLPAALGSKSLPRPAEVFPSMVKALAEAWSEFPPTTVVDSVAISSDVPVSSQVHRRLSEIVRKSDEIKDQPSIGKHLASSLYRSQERRDDEFVHRWVVQSFDDEYKFFVKRAHLATQLDKVPTDDGLGEHFQSFERAFHSLVGPYFAGKEELDAILRETNQRTD